MYQYVAVEGVGISQLDRIILYATAQNQTAVKGIAFQHKGILTALADQHDIAAASGILHGQRIVVDPQIDPQHT